MCWSQFFIFMKLLQNSPLNDQWRHFLSGSLRFSRCCNIFKVFTNVLIVSFGEVGEGGVRNDLIDDLSGLFHNNRRLPRHDVSGRRCHRVYHRYELSFVIR